MPKKPASIPVNRMADEFGDGISIDRVSFTDLNLYEDGDQSHRHDGHAFFLLESGTVSIEIDFEKYTITSPSVIYIHPDQVHYTIASENVIVNSLAITNERLNPEYAAILESINPAKPIVLDKEMFSLFTESFSLCIKFAEREDNKLYYSLLKDSCNALVALIISQYLALAKPADKLSRFETVTKLFRELLEQKYNILKRPSEYAEKLNLSTPYLNECVKNTTGHPVTHHIQQRVILEAKRLLYYSDKSVKEISFGLGYNDYPYFSRLFTKVTGITALTFRNKNLE